MSKDNDKIQQARRAAFESSLETRNRQRAESGFDALKPEEVRQMWWAFNAALDCVVIELPVLGICAMTNENLGYQRGIRDSRDAIESTNLGLKTK